MSSIEKKHQERSGTLTHAVYHALKEDICTGKVQSGELLSESQIAAHMGVSRTPVREALAALEKEGLVEIKRGVGASVKRLSLEDIVHIYELRKLLEPLAAQTAVEHISKEFRACRKQFQNLLKHQNETPQQQMARYTEVDWQLHMMLIRNCENPFIGTMMDLLIPNIRRLQAISYSPGNYSPQDAVNQHLELIDALESKDIVRIREQMDHHLNWSLAGFIASSILI